MIQEKYVKEMSKALKCTKSRKKAICKDLEADIASALENGETWEEIQDRMGLPNELAVEFNDNLSETEKTSKKKVFIFSIAFAVVALGMLSVVVIYQQKEASKNIFSKCGEASFVNMAEKIVTLVNEEDDVIIESEYEKINLENIVPLKTIMSTKENLSEKNTGKFQKIVSSEVSQWDDEYSSYGVVGVTALYENNTLLFEVSFDKNLKLWLLSYGDSDSTRIKK